MQSNHTESNTAIARATMSASSWRLNLELTPQLLKTRDPLPWLVELAGQWLGPVLNSSRLSTVLSELYHNALDHGVLGMDSSFKQDAAGYAAYYDERRRRLDALEEGCVTICMSHELSPHGGRLVIEVTDSGEGFVPTADAQRSSRQSSGRGLSLLKALCSGLKVMGRGNSVQVTLNWSDSPKP